MNLVLLSLIVVALGALAARLGLEAMVGWVIGVLQFHPTTYAPIVTILGVSIVPFDAGLLLLLFALLRARMFSSHVIRLQLATDLTRVGIPLAVLLLFVVSASVSLILAVPLLGSDVVGSMTVTFIKLLEWPALFVLLYLVLTTGSPGRPARLVALVAALGIGQSSYAIAASFLRTFFLIDVTPGALGLPAEYGPDVGLPIYAGFGPFPVLFEARSSSLIGGAPPTAMLAAVSALLSFMLARSSWSVRARRLWSAGAVICLAAVVLSLTRTSWVALLVACVFVLLTLPRRSKLAFLGLALSAAALVMPFYPILTGRAVDVIDPASLEVTARLLDRRGSSSSSGPSLAPSAHPAVTQPVAVRTERPVLNPETKAVVVQTDSPQAIGERSTLNLRIGTWSLGLNYIAQRPVFGYGWSAPAYIVDEAFLHRLFPTLPPEYFVSNAGSMHNVYLDLAVGTGLLGLALFVVFVLSMLIPAWRLLGGTRNLTPVAAPCLFGAFVYLAVAAMGDSWFSAGNPVGWLPWLLAAVLVALAGQQRRAKAAVSDSKRVMMTEHSSD